jgi:hypothetical protein
LETWINSRELAQDENRATIGFDATRMSAIGAEAFIAFLGGAIAYRRHIFSIT